MLVIQMLAADIDRVYEIASVSLDEVYVKEVFFLFISGWPAGQLVAVNDIGTIIGFLSGARLTSDKVTIPLFGVDPRYRRMKAGSRLMEEFRMRTVMDGKQYVQLEVKDTNTAAIAFYRSQGFVPVEYLDSFYNTGSNAVRMICGAYGNA